MALQKNCVKKRLVSVRPGDGDTILGNLDTTFRQGRDGYGDIGCTVKFLLG